MSRQRIKHKDATGKYKAQPRSKARIAAEQLAIQQAAIADKAKPTAAQQSIAKENKYAQSVEDAQG